LHALHAIPFLALMSASVAVLGYQMIKRNKKENKRKTNGNITRSSDSQQQQPKTWTTERNGTMQRKLASLEY